MLERVLWALAVGVIVWLACILLGKILVLLAFPVAVVIGGFLTTFAVVIAVVAFILQFVRNGALFR